MLKKSNNARVTLFIFIITGGLWFALARLLPANSWRDALTIILTFLFCLIFMWSLFSTLQRIYGGQGNL